MHQFFCAIFFIFIVLTAGCGGENDAAPRSNVDSAIISEANVQPVTVKAGLANSINAIFTSVTLCSAGGTANCQTIDHILVDTGSTGLRIMADVLSVPLLQQTGRDSKAIAECAHFADGYTWGPVKIADLRIAGEHASALPIQVIGDPEFAAAPDSCSSAGPALNTARTFGANGVLGISVLRQDCGDACTQDANFGAYFSCIGTICDPATINMEQQVQNPVAMFATDNNGTMISLPIISSGGAFALDGSLIFGIGTRQNNSLGNAEIIGVERNTGNFSTIYNGQTYDGSFIDSGSNAIFFPDENLAVCGDFYCPSQDQVVTAINRGENGVNSVVSFTVANAAPLKIASPGLAVFGSLAGPNYKSRGFDWGLPFFFGRNVFTAIEGRSTSAGMGPYVAY